MKVVLIGLSDDDTRTMLVGLDHSGLTAAHHRVASVGQAHGEGLLAGTVCALVGPAGAAGDWEKTAGDLRRLAPGACLVAITGPGTRREPAKKTASPRTAYKTAHTIKRFAPTARQTSGRGTRQRPSPTTHPHTNWSLNSKAAKAGGGGPSGRRAIR